MRTTPPTAIDWLDNSPLLGLYTEPSYCWLAAPGAIYGSSEGACDAIGSGVVRFPPSLFFLQRNLYTHPLGLLLLLLPFSTFLGNGTCAPLLPRRQHILFPFSRVCRAVGIKRNRRKLRLIQLRSDFSSRVADAIIRVGYLTRERGGLHWILAKVLLLQGRDRLSRNKRSRLRDGIIGIPLNWWTGKLLETGKRNKEKDRGSNWDIRVRSLPLLILVSVLPP